MTQLLLRFGVTRDERSRQRDLLAVGIFFHSPVQIHGYHPTVDVLRGSGPVACAPCVCCRNVGFKPIANFQTHLELCSTLALVPVDLNFIRVRCKKCAKNVTDDP